MSSGAEQFLFRMWKFHLVAQFRERNQMVPFINNVDSNKIKDSCKFFTFQETEDLWPPWGRNFPGCNYPETLNKYAREMGCNELYGCLDCPFFKKSKNPITRIELTKKETNAQKRKERRTKREKTKSKTSSVEASANETPEEYKKRRRKERRIARQQAKS